MMARRRTWDDPWRHYPESKPIPTEDGIATSKARGRMADAWWSQRLVDLLDSYGLGTRMQRGRRYARQGQLVDFDVQPGHLVAQVQGSRRTPYLVTAAAPALSDAQWVEIEAAMRARVGFAARLLSGEVPPELEGVFADAGVTLLPTRWSDLRASCSCPDWENPCKHLAATMYVFADRLDADPWLLLTWRGRTREQLLAHLAAATTERSEITPWWPLVPGARLPDPPFDSDDLLGDPDATAGAGVLHRCEPLAADVRGVPIVDLLAAAYQDPPQQPRAATSRPRRAR
jgi:uncharacterized Zn finger protein